MFVASRQSIRHFSCVRYQHLKGAKSSSIVAGRYVKTLNSTFSSDRESVDNNRPMSSTPMMEAYAEDESRFALILGKPGGGKGTISGKILQVSSRRHQIGFEDVTIEYLLPFILYSIVYANHYNLKRTFRNFTMFPPAIFFGVTFGKKRNSDWRRLNT